jgi:chromosome segregation ATPase
MELLDELGNKVQALIKKYALLQAEHNSLQQTLTRQSAQITALTQQLDVTKAQLLAVEVAQALPDAGEKERVRKQLDAVIHEIDKVLTNLND